MKQILQSARSGELELVEVPAPSPKRVAAVIRRPLPLSRIRVEKFCATTSFASDKAFSTGFEAPEEIVVKLVPAGGFGETEEHILMREIRSRLGKEIGVRIDLVDAIPREANGKFRAVKSKVARLEP